MFSFQWPWGSEPEDPHLRDRRIRTDSFRTSDWWLTLLTPGWPPDSDSVAIPRGDCGEHQLKLCEDVNLLLSDAEFSEILAPRTSRTTASWTLTSDRTPFYDGTDMNDYMTWTMDNDPVDRSPTVLNLDDDVGGNTKEHGDEGLGGAATSHNSPPEIAKKVVDFASNANFGGVTGNQGDIKCLPKLHLHNMILEATPEKKKLKNALDRAFNVMDSKGKLVWEGFAGKGRTTTSLQKLGVQCERFSPKEGWNFYRAKGRKKFLKKLRDECPDEVWLAPMCRLWSPLQELSLAAHPRGNSACVNFVNQIMLRSSCSVRWSMNSRDEQEGTPTSNILRGLAHGKQRRFRKWLARTLTWSSVPTASRCVMWTVRSD